jgi:hypothetical protein
MEEFPKQMVIYSKEWKYEQFIKLITIVLIERMKDEEDAKNIISYCKLQCGLIDKEDYL